MTFEEALGKELEGIEGLSEKVFPLNAKEGTKAPYLIYVSSEGLYNKDLEGYQDTKEVSCEVNTLNTRYDNMKALGKAVFNKLKSFEGREIGIDGPYIQEVIFDDNCPEVYEEQVKLYRKIINVRFYYKEVL